MRTFLVALLCLIYLGACSGPKDTPLPQDLEKMDSIKPAIEKLKPEERELLGAYIARHTIVAKMVGLFGGKEGPGIPEGMTIGKAIDEQRKFKADQDIEEAKQKALKIKLEAEREAAMKAMRNTVTVMLISKDIKADYGYGGILMDENLRISIGYKNNTSKDIAGIKGRIVIKDLFGEDLTSFMISNDDTLEAGKEATWNGSRSVKYSMNEDKDRKFANLSDDKYKVIWEPRMIVFADGTKMAAPEQE